MRHARAEALAELADVLESVRSRDGLAERTPGSFYRKSAGFLHFHEDPAGLFADLKVDGAWQRFCVTSVEEQEALLELIESIFGAAVEKGR